MNQSGIRPQEFNVLVKPDAVETKTKGGIIIPESKLERDEFARTEGTLVAISPIAFSFDDWPEEIADQKPKVGDRVIFSRYQAQELTGRDGCKYWIMKDKSIVAVLEETE